MSTTSPSAPAPGQAIPTPPDFPVVWADPRDARITWMLNDRNRAPTLPLVSAVGAAFIEGNSAAFEQAGLPFAVRAARLNTYEYVGIVPRFAPPDVVMKAMGLLNRAAPGVFKLVMSKMMDGMSRQQLAALDPIVDRFAAHWQDEVLPEIKQHIAFFESLDVPNLSLDELTACLEETIRRVTRMGALHGVVVPAGFAMSQFEELYRELFAGASTLDALRLLQGLDNKTLEGDRALWQLSRVALATPEVRQILASRAPIDAIAALEASEPCQTFLAELRAWLAGYGQRLNSAFALGEPSWIEDPSPVVEYLRAYLTQAEQRPEIDPVALAKTRDEAVAQARARLAEQPGSVAARFERLLAAAQMAAVVHEDHNHWIDQKLFYHVRRLLLEFGRRLSDAGFLDDASEVLYLTPDELRDARSVPIRHLIRERKAEMERYRYVMPPAMLGTMPAFEMGEGGPVIRALFKGEMSPPEPSGGGAFLVTGKAGSAGVARGRAKVVRSLAEAGKLEPGDVLVAEFTVPPWTPLFATAAAVVTDVGGVLSHSAVVAREYRIPAVVGTTRGTKTFQDGQLLEVDGTAGTVRVIAEEAE